MVRRLSHLLLTWRRPLPVTAGIAVAALLYPVPSASAATPLTGEVLTGAGTTSNWTSNCSFPWGSFYPFVGMSFSVSGEATGPISGTFVESGHVSAQGKQQFGAAHASATATFTIRSGGNTITGTLSLSHGWSLVGYGCNSGYSGGVSLLNMGVSPANYTAVINGQTYQGTGSIGGSFYTNLASEPSASVSDSFTG